ncbi:MAG: hypothetical protein LUQ22_06360 [Methanotrichaceae archaeon]|nr:hypothetical protein [Methanotrichaceae archaeon]
MKRITFLLISLCIMGATAVAGDWLGGGYVGSPNYGEIRQYFTDPIFNTKVPVSQPLSFYNPFYARPFSREPLYLGKYTARPGQLGFQASVSMRLNPDFATQSEFRNRSLAAMQWKPFMKNWTNTTTYASQKSSFRVIDGGTWRTL